MDAGRMRHRENGTLEQWETRTRGRWKTKTPRQRNTDSLGYSLIGKLPKKYWDVYNGILRQWDNVIFGRRDDGTM